MEEKLDHRKSTKRDHPEDATRIDTCGDENKSLVNAESMFSIPKLISGISQYAYDDTLLVYEVDSGFQYSILKGNGMLYISESSADTNRVIVADLKNRRLGVYENEVPICATGNQAVIDLDTKGRRWEGEVNNGKPFGHGVIYDEEGRKEYEGFMINESKTCYGVEYYSDIGRVQYDGCFHNNKRFGKGTLYDRNGVVNYEGLWKNDMPYSSSFDGKTIDNCSESISIPDKSFNESTTFLLRSFPHSLRRIVIGYNCFECVCFFELDGLSELESVEVERISFTYSTENEAVDNSKRADSTCRIVNCSKLKSIRINDCSFSGYHTFELNSLPSLRSIDIGSCCFSWTSSFSLTGLVY